MGLQNSQKAITGYESGLLDKAIMDKKATDETALRASFKADPKNAGAADPWEEIAQAIKVQQAIYPNLIYLERLRGFFGAPGADCPGPGAGGGGEAKAESGAHAGISRLHAAVARAATVLDGADL